MITQQPQSNKQINGRIKGAQSDFCKFTGILVSHETSYFSHYPCAIL